MLSSVFKREIEVKEMSVQCMRRSAQKEPVCLAVVRSMEGHDDQKEVDDDHTIEINKEKTKKLYPKEVQEILMEYADVSVRIFRQDYPIREMLITGLSWFQGQNHFIRHNTECHCRV